MRTKRNPTLPALRTERLVLRALSASDLDAWHELLVDSPASRFGQKPPSSKVQSEERLLRSLALQADGDLLTWVIAEGDDEPMVGYVSLVRIDRSHRRSEVGYQLRSDRWHRGLMTEALGSMVSHAFGGLNFHRLEGHADPENLPSIRVLERCGFAFEGTLRENYLLNGVFHDSAVYARLEGEPQARS